MLRIASSALAALALSAGLAPADEIKAVVKAVDADAYSITVTADGKDATYHVALIADVDVNGAKELKDVKPGAKVVLTMIQGNIDGKDQPVVRTIKAQK